MSNHDELFPDRRTVMVGDMEMPRSIKPRLRDLPPITAEEVEAHTKPSVPTEPRPAVTAWEGADLDAYWFDNGYWRHCQTGAEWVMSSIDEVQGRINAAQGLVCRPIDEQALVASVADALGVSSNERRAEFFGACDRALQAAE